MDISQKRTGPMLSFSGFCEAIDRGEKPRKTPKQRLRGKRPADHPGEYDGAGNDVNRYGDSGTFIYAMELIPEP